MKEVNTCCNQIDHGAMRDAFDGHACTHVMKSVHNMTDCFPMLYHSRSRGSTLFAKAINCSRHRQKADLSISHVSRQVWLQN